MHPGQTIKFFIINHLRIPKLNVAGSSPVSRSSVSDSP